MFHRVGFEGERDEPNNVQSKAPIALGSAGFRARWMRCPATRSSGALRS